MLTITYITPSEKECTVEAEVGFTLMEIAVKNDIEGIDADCGGSCACATCHIIVPREFTGIIGKAHDDENSLLDFLENRQSGSRLSCQIEMTGELDGITVKVPLPE